MDVNATYLQFSTLCGVCPFCKSQRACVTDKYDTVIANEKSYPPWFLVLDLVTACIYSRDF
eukprot:3507743-Pleurochrysis_carterae.AAC.4